MGIGIYLIIIEVAFNDTFMVGFCDFFFQAWYLAAPLVAKIV
jgi:hypothetical protein